MSQSTPMRLTPGQRVVPGGLKRARSSSQLTGRITGLLFNRPERQLDFHMIKQPSGRTDTARYGHFTVSGKGMVPVPAHLNRGDQHFRNMPYSSSRTLRLFHPDGLVRQAPGEQCPHGADGSVQRRSTVRLPTRGSCRRWILLTSIQERLRTDRWTPPAVAASS